MKCFRFLSWAVQARTGMKFQLILHFMSGDSDFLLTPLALYLTGEMIYVPLSRPIIKFYSSVHLSTMFLSGSNWLCACLMLINKVILHLIIIYKNTFDTFFFNLNPAEVNQDQNINTLWKSLPQLDLRLR